jgi:heme exporter protein B
MSGSCSPSSWWPLSCSRWASAPRPTCWRASPPGSFGAPPCSLQRLFAADYEDGTLDLLLLAPWPLELAALAKCLAHWIVTGLPLSLLAPVLGVAFGLDGPSLLALMATLLVGTPTLSLIALTLGARKSGALLALLALPLCVPTLIFGAGAIETLAAGDGIVTHVAILAALALVALATTPWAIAAALRQAGE